MIVHEVSGHLRGLDSVSVSETSSSLALEVRAIQPAFEALTVASIVLGELLPTAGDRALFRAVALPAVVWATDVERLRAPPTPQLQKGIQDGTRKLDNVPES